MEDGEGSVHLKNLSLHQVANEEEGKGHSHSSTDHSIFSCLSS